MEIDVSTKEPIPIDSIPEDFDTKDHRTRLSPSLFIRACPAGNDLYDLFLAPGFYSGGWWCVMARTEEDDSRTLPGGKGSSHSDGGGPTLLHEPSL